MATRVALPENFGTGRQPNKAHPARTGSQLPQWLVLYVLLPKEGSGQKCPAEIRMACRATEVYEGCWDRASEAESHEFSKWLTQRRRRRGGEEGDSLKHEGSFFCWVLDKCFRFDEAVSLLRDQCPGQQLQRAFRPGVELRNALSKAPGQHLLGGLEDVLLGELCHAKAWLIQVPGNISFLSLCHEVEGPLKLWTPGSLVASTHVHVSSAPETEQVPAEDMEHAGIGWDDVNLDDLEPGEPMDLSLRGRIAHAARYGRDTETLSPMQEIQMVRLNFSLQNSSEIVTAVQCVARFLEPITGAMAPELLQRALLSVPGRGKLRSGMIRLDMLHMLYRRSVMQKQVRCHNVSVSRYLSMDASPQCGYEYLAMTEEILTRASPTVAAADPWSGFEHTFRTMPVMTLARGETRTYVKAQRLRSAIILENGQDHFDVYRRQVKGWVSDQGTEKGIPHWPMGNGQRMNELVAGLQEPGAGVEAVVQGTAEAFLPNSFSHPGMLHILFNSLEETCKSCPRWDQVEKQVSAVSKLLTNRSFREVVLSKMMAEAPWQDKKLVQGYHGELLSWRWESLHQTLKHYLNVRPVLSKYWDREQLSSEASLCDAVDGALKDPFHLGYVEWAWMFSCFIQKWAHWFEGCFCHEEQLQRAKTRKAKVSLKCCWKGRRSCVLSAGFTERLLASIQRLTSTSYTQTVLELPSEVAAGMALMDQQARDKWVSIMSEKLQYLSHVPFSLAGAYAHYARPDLYDLQHSKRIVLDCFEEYRSLKEQGRSTWLLQHLFERQSPGGLADQLYAFAQSGEEAKLEHFPLAWAEIQERAFCSLVERSTERQHVLIKIAGRRTLRNQGPAMTCVRARRAQLLDMIAKPEQCGFLLQMWQRKHIMAELLSHLMTKHEAFQKTQTYKVARIYCYHEADHFMQEEELGAEKAADDLHTATKRALCAGAEDNVQARGLQRKQWMIVDYLKSQLQTGVLFSLPHALFEALLLGTESDALQPEVQLTLQDFAEALMPADIPENPAEDRIYGYILDSRPERRAQQRGVAEVDRRCHLKVLRFLNVDIRDPLKPVVTYSSVQQHTLDLALFATPEGLGLLSSQCLCWASTAKTVQVQVMVPPGHESQLEAIAAQPAAALQLPDFVTDDDLVLDAFAAGPEANNLLSAQVQEQQAGPVAVAATGALLSRDQEDFLQALLQARALGDNYVQVLHLPYFNARACQALLAQGLVQAREDDFGDMLVALSDATKLTSVVCLENPVLLCDDEVVMQNPAGRNKLAWLKKLLQADWSTDEQPGEWHKQGDENHLPEKILDRPESHFKALCFQDAIWEKPGELRQISHSGSAAYYEMLLQEADLSGVQDWTLAQCQGFTASRKRRVRPRAQTAPLRFSLDLPSLPSQNCRIPGMSDFVVHFDNWTHTSGHRRAFIQCRDPRHGNCRRYTFLRSHASQATAVAWLFAWVQAAHQYATSKDHVAFNPADAVIERVQERQRLGA